MTHYGSPRLLNAAPCRGRLKLGDGPCDPP